MIEVFKTNVQHEEDAQILVKKLTEHFPHYKINFDLMDSDNILRVEGEYLRPQSIINYMHNWSYQCHVLD